MTLKLIIRNHGNNYNEIKITIRYSNILLIQLQLLKRHLIKNVFRSKTNFISVDQINIV